MSGLVSSFLNVRRKTNAYKKKKRKKKISVFVSLCLRRSIFNFPCCSLSRFFHVCTCAGNVGEEGASFQAEKPGRSVGNDKLKVVKVYHHRHGSDDIGNQRTASMGTCTFSGSTVLSARRIKTNGPVEDSGRQKGERSLGGPGPKTTLSVQ